MTIPSNFASVKLPLSLVNRRAKRPNPCADQWPARLNIGPLWAVWSSIQA
jgi:hypothetical protein